MLLTIGNEVIDKLRLSRVATGVSKMQEEFQFATVIKQQSSMLNNFVQTLLIHDILHDNTELIYNGLI